MGDLFDLPADDDEIMEVFGVPFREPRSIVPNFGNNPQGKNLRMETAKWIKDHPKTAELFFRFARQSAVRGKRFGMKAIAERVRWEINIEGEERNGEAYKISNDLIAYLGRWIIARDKSIEPFLRFKKVRY